MATAIEPFVGIPKASSTKSVVKYYGVTLLYLCLFLEMIATQEQMNLAQVPLEQRDYCAHYLLKLMKCKRDNWPNFLGCKHERHDWDYCEHQE